jgi:DNA-binding IclR family transcriptional regulator
LKTLIEAGYVKKPGYRSFAPDYGILCLGGIAAQQFALAKKPLPGLSELIRSLEGFEFALGCLWDSQIVYFLRVHNSLGASGPSAGRFPLQSSSIALRILLELPEAQALKALEDSRRRYGWECSGLELPPTPKALLKAAQTKLSDECLVWERKGASGVGASIILRLAGEPLAALALSGPAGVFSNERLALSLHEGRRIVEESLR